MLPPTSALAPVLGAPLIGPDAPVRSVSIDSRRVAPGDLFFALPGRHVDGHRFVDAALDGGAAAVVVRPGTTSRTPRFEVPSPLAALQALAAHHRRSFGRVLAITGSNGKTVVKDALVALLSTRFRVAASPGSWNSQVGVPLAVLAAPAGTELGIFEAGISEPGEMTVLADILRPDIGVLTNIGSAHQAAFGSRAAIAREKSLLFRDLPADGWVMAPPDPLVTLPRLVHPDLRNTCVTTSTGTLLTVELPGETVRLPVRTRSAPLLDDLLLAITVATRLGVSPADISAALQDYSFGPTRMETWRTPDGVTIVNDAASADPLSVQAALDTVASSPEATGRRIFVFGGMREEDDAEHARVGKMAAERGFTHLVLPPSPSREATARGWRSVTEAPVLLPEDAGPALRAALHPLATAGDTLLVKGSRQEGLADAARALWESMAPRRFVVDLAAVRGNIARIRTLCGSGIGIMAVLKAWAYGTEIARMAAGLQASGVDWIGVSAADEGAVARRAGVHLPILVMLPDLDEVDKLVRHRLTPVVYSMAFARALADAVRTMGATLDVHLEIDTGMGRLGVAPDEALAAARLLRASGALRLTGVMTHLASADDPAADTDTHAQLDHFDRVVAEIRAEGPVLAHAAATSGAVRFPRSRYDLVRVGLGLYGIYPSPAIRDGLELELAVAFSSRLAQVAVWPRGKRVGYNGTYTIEADHQRVGIVSAGYNDGVPWRLSNQGEVMLHGRRVRVLGRVSMDSMAIDLTDVPDAVVGDEVLLFGARDGQELRPEEVAARAGTIPYELLVKVDSRRVQRVFVGD